MPATDVLDFARNQQLNLAQSPNIVFAGKLHLYGQMGHFKLNTLMRSVRGSAECH